MFNLRGPLFSKVGPPFSKESTVLSVFSRFPHAGGDFFLNIFFYLNIFLVENQVMYGDSAQIFWLILNRDGIGPVVD